MTVIRGATTISQDNPDEIRAAVAELLNQIESRNSLKRDEILSMVFSSTSDIHSFYPAKAAREAGFVSCSLFSAQEPEIDGWACALYPCHDFCREEYYAAARLFARRPRAQEGSCAEV